MGELDLVEATYELICRLFLFMLAQLERKALLSNESEIENLGLMIPLFMVFAGIRDGGESSEEEEDSESEDSKPEDSEPEDSDAKAIKEPPSPASNVGQWNPDALDSLILAYARKYDIALFGDTNLEKTIRHAKVKVKLPDPGSSMAGEDPWEFSSYLEQYKIEHRGIMATMAVNFPGITPIGGDNLDLSTWSSTKRRAASSGQMSDPLTKVQVEALKKGMVLSFLEHVPERGWDVEVSVLITTQGRVVSKELL